MVPTAFVEHKGLLLIRWCQECNDPAWKHAGGRCPESPWVRYNPWIAAIAYYRSNSSRAAVQGIKSFELDKRTHEWKDISGDALHSDPEDIEVLIWITCLYYRGWRG